MIRAVLFDLDGTLYDRDRLVADLVKEQFAFFAEDLADVGEAKYVERVLDLDDHGYGSKPELYETIAREWALSPGLAGRLLEHFREAYGRHCALPDDTRATLDALRAHGLALGLITNGSTQIQEQKLVSLGLDSFFDVVLVSEREGLRKPDPRIFARALERCRARPQEAVFVGDHPEVDVAGSKAAGLVPIWKRVPYWEMTVDGAVTVDTLAEILPTCLNA